MKSRTVVSNHVAVNVTSETTQKLVPWTEWCGVLGAQHFKSGGPTEEPSIERPNVSYVRVGGWLESKPRRQFIDARRNVHGSMPFPTGGAMDNLTMIAAMAAARTS